jgi:hypothetical protein
LHQKGIDLIKQIKEFEYKETNYRFNKNVSSFETMYDKDLQLLIIWSKARTKEKEIINELTNNFNIVNCFEIHWNEKNIDDNFHRIYDVAPTGGRAGKRDEVGDKSFVVIILEDTNPNYQYRYDASERFKIVNSNVVDKKQLFRKWVGGSYMVHSTDNINEFFNNAILLFGKEKLYNFLETKSWDNTTESISSDLIGANGWNSVSELFNVLNIATQYVVLRGADNIEETVETLSGDIDILCSNIGEFTAVANARNIWNSKNFFHVNIMGKDILFDIRYIGDEYFDSDWQKRIMNTRVLTKNKIYIPRVDEYFFSHLYHAYIHKPYFYDKYINRLDELAKQIGIDDFKDDCKNNIENIKKLLRGYLLANNYKITIPKDEQAYINIDFISQLQNINKFKLYLRLYTVKIKNTPNKIFTILKIAAKKNEMIFSVLFKLRAKYNQYFRAKK